MKTVIEGLTTETATPENTERDELREAAEQARKDFYAAPDYEQTEATEPEPQENAEPEQDAEPEEYDEPAADTEKPDNPEAQARHERNEKQKQKRVEREQRIAREAAAEATAKARAELKAEYDRIASERENARIAALGLTDPDTNAPIKTAAELDAFNAKQYERDIDEKLSVGTATAEDIKALAQRVAAKQLAAVEQQRQIINAQQQRQAQMNAIAQADIGAIKAKYDPNINTLADLQAKPEYPTLLNIIRDTRNAAQTLSQAYEVLNSAKARQEAERQAEIDRAVQAALAKEKGTGHLRGIPRGISPDNDAISPADIAEARTWSITRGLTDAQITEWIRQARKQ
ncbi:MAG: hypothetical protein LBN43_06295 [Oscillospiraceae bacterium]|jgi:hypothetical protein|nr:hypothetical protein [Oscillospiraceae bacterium]